MQHPKLAVLGCGSLFFGREAIWQMVHSPDLNGGTLALVDTDRQRLAKMAELARKVITHVGVKLAVEASADRREVLEGADFVVITFADESVKYRDIDCRVSAKYGVRMCSGDTIGPGGVFRALRELPTVMAVARDVERICPKAWLINYANPTAVMGVALKRFAPRLKTFALCDGNRMPGVRRHYAVRAGIVDGPEQYTDQVDRGFDMRIAGPNHFTWLIKAAYDGKDVLGRIADWFAREAQEEGAAGDSKQRFNSRITRELYDIFGAIPTAPSHTKEYVRFWQGLGKTPEPLPPLTLWDAQARYKRHDDMWKQVDDFLSGRLPIDQYMNTFSSDHATDIIETIWSGRKRRFYINTLNDGAVANMGPDRLMELLCDVDGDGPRPCPIGDVPAGLRGLMSQVLDTHELTAEAAVKCDRGLLRRAMLTDPLVSSIADADAIIGELMQAGRQALPDCWF